MIWSVRGPVQAYGVDWMVVLVGSVGMKIMVPPTTVSALATAADVNLFTELVVREDSLTLYGFDSARARDSFQKLLGVSGVGPRTALAAISVLGPDELARAVQDGDEAALVKIPGVGKKSAQRMLLELGGKLKLDAPGVVDSVRDDVETALEQLGWNKAQVAKALDSLDPELTDPGEMVRAALQKLAGTNG